MRRRFLIAAATLFIPILQAQIDTTGPESLGPVEIEKQGTGHRWDTRGIRLSEDLDQNEFKRAACCTLSESFELNNTVELSNADGISGIKQIEMLGLAGKYVNMSRDNIPMIQGLNLLNGLTAVPGPMVSNVHISKGSASATLGHDGITGALNYALAAEPTGDRIFFNAFQNNQMRREYNAILKNRLGAKTFNHTYLNGAWQDWIMDRNGDGFSDMPQSARRFISNHSQHYADKFEAQWGLTHWVENKSAGAVDSANARSLIPKEQAFGFESREKRTEAYAKLGVFLNEDASSSWGNIVSWSQHEHASLLNSLIGRHYQGQEKRLEYQSFYQSPMIAEGFNVKAGISIMASRARETLQSDAFKTPSSMLTQADAFSLNREERNAAAFAEWVKEGELSWVLGLRVDRNNLFGTFVSPRWNLKWELNPNHKFYAMGGMGRRSPWALVEYLPLLLSSRELLWMGNASQPYRLQQEQALNYGISYNGKGMFLGYPLTWNIDAFQTDFQAQTVMDRDAHAEQLHLQTRTGAEAGYTQTLHAEASGYFHRRFSFKIAYRYVNNQMWLGRPDGTYGFQQAPFQSPHRGLLVWGYETRSNWYMDLSSQLNGPKRLSHGAYWNAPDLSPFYAVWNGQIRKSWEHLDLYLGLENATNRMAPAAIRIKPEYDFVDASYAWGPTNGRTLYLGLRYYLR